MKLKLIFFKHLWCWAPSPYLHVLQHPAAFPQNHCCVLKFSLPYWKVGNSRSLLLIENVSSWLSPTIILALKWHTVPVIVSECWLGCWILELTKLNIILSMLRIKFWESAPQKTLLIVMLLAPEIFMGALRTSISRYWIFNLLSKIRVKKLHFCVKYIILNFFTNLTFPLILM